MRILTVKNAVWTLAGLLLLFIAFSAYHELRSPDRSRERLYERGSGSPPPAPKPRPAAAIEERPVADETFAARSGPYALAPAPRATPAAAPIRTGDRPRQRTLKQTRQRGERTVIVGGPEGVRVQTAPATATTTLGTAAPPNGAATPRRQR